MNSYTDLFVAAIALVASVIALGASLGPWMAPYRLRTMSRVVERFGMTTARFVWMLIATVSLLAGIAIASGIRPSYAQPDTNHADTAR